MTPLPGYVETKAGLQPFNNRQGWMCGGQSGKTISLHCQPLQGKLIKRPLQSTVAEADQPHVGY
jgi:hypothetical protein